MNFARPVMPDARAVFILVALPLLLVLQACQPTPVPTPTPTPLPTSTSTPTPSPTPTPTPMPTSTPTPTITPTPTSPSVVVTLSPDEQPLLNPEESRVPDNWLWFESEEFGFRIAYPPDWLALDLSKEEWQTLVENVEDEGVRQILTDQITSMLATNTAALITAAIPEQIAGNQPFVSNLNIIRTSVPADATQDLLIQGIVANLKQIPGLRPESLNRGRIGEYPAAAVLYTYPMKAKNDRVYPIVGWQVYIRTAPDTLYVLTFTTVSDVFPERIVNFARMAGSFTVLSK